MLLGTAPARSPSRPPTVSYAMGGREGERAGPEQTENALVADTERERTMDDKTRIELEAAAFRRLVAHLRRRTDVQNIDLMNLSGFCRNCLSKWYRAEAEERGMEMSYDQARELVYGMPYAEWRDKYQTEATAEQKQAYEQSHRQAGH